MSVNFFTVTQHNDLGDITLNAEHVVSICTINKKTSDLVKEYGVDYPENSVVISTVQENTPVITMESEADVKIKMGILKNNACYQGT